MFFRTRTVKKRTAVFIALLMIFNLFVSGFKVLAATPETIAAWDYTAAPASSVVPATSGANTNGAVLTNFKNATPTYSTTSLSINGWDGGAGTKFWQLSLSTKGYDNLTLSAKTRSSGTGPKEFKVIYSVDNGTTWVDVPNSAYAITGTALSNYMPTLSLPAGAADAEKLLLRFIMTSNVSEGNGTVASGGASNINNIVVVGTPVTNSATVGGITASPDGGAVAQGSKVELTCPTDGATIMYSVNNNAFAAYDSAVKITLDSLPATIKAYGTKAGMNNSVTSTWEYTQAQVAPVTASPNGGSVYLNKNVTLTCTTPNSTITYSLDGGNTWSTYISPIVLTKLPAEIKAYATSAGMVNSVISSYNFTQRVNGEMNIYFGQLHSHTTNSDGIGTVDDAFSYAKAADQIDFLAITDHSNSFDNAAASSIADGSKSTEWVGGLNSADKFTDSTFVGIYAYEMTWSNGLGHINTFNTPGFENRETAKYKASDALKNYYDVLKQYPESISQFNHPGKTFGDFSDFAYYDPQIDNEISLIEVGNGEGPVRGSGYFPSYDYYTRALDKGWHVSPTNNQDNHKGKWGDANTARTVVLSDSLTRDGIYDAMRNMRTYATEDNNLRIKYTLNNEVMGTIISEKPASVSIKVDLEDPDNEVLGKVSVICNGGIVAVSKTIDSSKGTVEFILPADYSYYYIRVDEADQDIAVTAPVWIGEVEKAGISKTTGSTTMPLKGESFKITTDLYNNESVPMNIKSLTYTIDGNLINTAPTQNAVNSLGTASYSFDYTALKAGKFNVDVKLVAEINGVEKIYSDVLKLNIADPAITTKVVIDASHFNDYVWGYYANNMNNFTTIANGEGVAVNIEKNQLTDAALADAQLLVLTAPAKKPATNSAGISYLPQSYSDEDLAVIKRFVDKGGNLMVCAIADYQDGTGVYQSSTQQNRMLEAIGATSRINNDEVVDNANHVGSQAFRLAFDDYNMDSPYLNGVVTGQTYSFYSGCSISLDANALGEGKTTWLVKGHDTTGSIDSNTNLPGIALPQGSVYALAVENLSGGGKMFIGGTVYISDFEVKATLDNYSQQQYSNYNITMNVLDSIKKVVPVTPITKVRAANIGDTFCVEGTVTAGTTAGNAFFDTIYIQDQTGGINIFPVSGMDIKVGQKVKVTGSVDEYLGDRELRVIDIAVTDTTINPLPPTVMSTKDAMDSKNGGLLVKVQGTVTKAEIINNVLAAVYVKDESGLEARVFIDGYIGYSNTESTALENIAKVGNVICSVGLASTDPEGNRLRVRDRSEIILIATAQEIADKAAAKAVMDLINAIPAAVTLADKARVTEARTAYEDLTDAQKVLVTNLSKLTAAEAAIAQLEEDKAAVDAVISKIDAIPAVVTLGDKAKVDEARAAYNALTEAQKALVTNLAKLTAAEEAITQLETDKAAADVVISKIDAIPVALTLADKAMVEETRAAYNALTEAQKALVTNLAKLTAAEEAITQLETDKAAADAVISKIDAIPAVVTLDDKGRVREARAAYDALTTAQKALVTNLAKLTAAEAAMAQLEAYKAAADPVVAAIAAIPETITLTDKAKVDAARAAYDALTEAQKVFVTNLDKLIAAEAAIAQLEVDQARSTLSDAINSAQGKYASAVVGKGLGQYSETAKSALQEAISKAEEVKNNESATAQMLAQATTELNAAISVFDSAKITVVIPKTGSPVDFGGLMNIGMLVVMLGVIMFIAGKKRRNNEDAA